MLEVLQSETISDFAPEEWDAATLHPLSSFGWLRTVEQEDPRADQFLYLVSHDEQGIGAAFQCAMYSGKLSLVDRLVYGSAAPIAHALGLRISPAILVQKRILRPGITVDQQRRHLNCLLDALEKFAAERSCRICFEQVIHSENGDPEWAAGDATTDSETTLEELLLHRGLLWGVDLPIAYLETSRDWKQFGDYRRDLKRQHRKTGKHIKLELNRGKRYGLSICKVDDSNQDTLLFGLLDSHYQRLNHRPLPYAPSFFATLRANLGDRFLLRSARRENQLAGVSVGIHHGNRVAFPQIGIDHQIGGVADAYANLAYNHAIDTAIGLGARRLYLGMLAYDTKIRRGASLQHTRFYIALPGRAERLLFSLLMTVRQARLERKFGSAVMNPDAGLPRRVPAAPGGLEKVHG